MASIFRLTPMTPVDATSTCMAAHSTAAAVSSTISWASATPCGPVQALAHPLLVTIAWATPLLAASWSSQRITGAALARLVVKTPAALAGASVAISARSGLPDALMPQARPVARTPRGAVTPPSMRRMSDTAGGGARRGARRRLCRSPLRAEFSQLEQHGVLATGAEERTACAVVRDFLGHPRVRHDREPEPDEQPCVVRKGAETQKPLAASAPSQLIHHPPGESDAASIARDDKRANLGDRLRQRGQLGASDDPIEALRRNDSHEESCCVHLELVESPRKQMPFLEMRRDQLVNGGRVGCRRGAQRRRRRGPLQSLHRRAPARLARSIVND